MNNMLENCQFTLNTTRICGDDPVDISIEISPITYSNMRPNTVILVNKNEVFDAIAATSLVHFPFNAPILFTDCNNLRKETLKEIKRLSPKGHNGTQIILIGNFSESVSCELKKHGFKTQDIEGGNYYETACTISRVRKDFKNILIISGEDYSEGIAAGYWSAHHGDPILYTKDHEMMGMEHDNYDSDCMHMKHMEMKHGGDSDLDHMHHMCHKGHLMEMEHDDEHGSDHMHNMCYEKHMMKMGHDDNHDLDCIHHMCNKEHMMEMEHYDEYDSDHMHHMYHNEEEKNDEMIYNSNQKVEKNHEFGDFSSNYKRVGLDEILG